MHTIYDEEGDDGEGEDDDVNALKTANDFSKTQTALTLGALWCTAPGSLLTHTRVLVGCCMASANKKAGSESRLF